MSHKKPVTFQMRINTGEVDIAGLSDDIHNQVLKVHIFWSGFPIHVPIDMFLVWTGHVKKMENYFHFENSFYKFIETIFILEIVSIHL